MLKKNLVGWFEIYVDNLERARQFYETVFEVQLESLLPPDQELQMWAFPGDAQTYGAPGALVHMPGFPAGRNSVIVYFTCADCAVEEKRAVAAGGKVHRSRLSIGQYGFISLVYDTEGNMIGLHTPAPMHGSNAGPG